MNWAVADCLVEDYEDLVESLTLPDANDRHVLAAGIRATCNAIITFNLPDFPQDYLARFEIEALHPDDFLFHRLGSDAIVVGARRCRARLKNPPRTAAEYLDTLARQGLPRTVARLRQYAAEI